MADKALEVKGLSKEFRLPHERKNSLKEWILHFRRPTYERFRALKDIDFQVERGEFFGIVGRNGSGKSTLLKIIGGIYQPTKGTVKVNGTLTPFIELGIGFNPELTGRENVFLNGSILGLTHKQTAAKYDEIVAFAELEKFMDQKLKNYSSGMQVRLAFAIAIQAHNDILLIDEVLAVGDERFQRKCLAVFDRLKKDKSKTIIFVSHDMQTIQQYCDRAMVIHDSQVHYLGNPHRAALEYRKLNFPEMSTEANTSTASTARNDQRAGTGKVRILKFDVISNNKKDRIINFGEPFTISFTYQAEKDLKSIVFGIALKNKQGQSIYGPNTKESNLLLDLEKGKRTISVTIKDNIFSPGFYSLEAGFFNESGSICHDYVSVSDALTFVGIERHGYVHVEPEWVIK